MSFVLSESTNKTGLFEKFGRLTKTNSSSYSLYIFASDANEALADYFINLAIPSSGKWQVDDTNQTDYPEIKVNLVSGQFDYPLTTDASSVANKILDIERVECASELNALTTGFRVLNAYNEMKDEIPAIVASRGITGVPVRYSKRANGIFLDPTPNFSATNGLRIFYARSASYFLGDGTDNTKVAGIPDDHQRYLTLLPAYKYCVINLPQLANGYLAELVQMKKDIKAYYAFRNRDERNIMGGKKILYI